MPWNCLLLWLKHFWVLGERTWSRTYCLKVLRATIFSTSLPRVDFECNFPTADGIENPQLTHVWLDCVIDIFSHKIHKMISTNRLLLAVDFEMWHLGLITGLVVVISLSRYTLLKTWPDFAESSDAANRQVVALPVLSTSQTDTNPGPNLNKQQPPSVALTSCYDQKIDRYILFWCRSWLHCRQ